MTVHPGLRLTDDDLKAFEFFGQFDELPSKIRECIGKAVAEIRERRAADVPLVLRGPESPDEIERCRKTIAEMRQRTPVIDVHSDLPADCIKCGEPLGGAGYGYPVAAPDGCRWLPGRAHGRCMTPEEMRRGAELVERGITAPWGASTRDLSTPRERHAELPRWTPFISPDLVALASEDEDGTGMPSAVTTLREAVAMVACPRCQQPAGSPCVVAGVAPLTQRTHLSRWDLANLTNHRRRVI